VACLLQLVFCWQRRLFNTNATGYITHSLLTNKNVINEATTSPQAKNVKLVTAAQKKNCEFIKTVSSRQLIGPDKTGDALKLALNEAGEANANAFYVMSSANEGGVKGGVVTGEALRCKP
jgi:hypothetical protein